MYGYPHPDEEEMAMKLYAREIEENNTYSAVAKEVIDDWRDEHGGDDDKPDRVRLYTR